MTEEKTTKDVHLGMFDRPRHSKVLPGDMIAAGLSVLWVVVCGIFLLAAQRPGASVSFSTLNFVVTVLAVLLPVALIWVAAVAARSVSVVREESMRLQAAMDILRQNYVDLAQSKRLQVTPAQTPATAPAALSAPLSPPGPSPVPASVEAAPDAGPKATFSSSRAHGPRPGQQQDLALGIPPADALPLLTSEDFIRALNFPKTVDDKAGFRSLKRAMGDPVVGRLVQAAQDILTLMSQDGVYMDDLIPDRARPDIWRKFADGERGRPVATLGGIRDRGSLTKVAKRMREDHIFRDAAHHFLRQFDRVFAVFAPVANDAEIAALSDTRTARAFMLLGRVAGTFD